MLESPLLRAPGEAFGGPFVRTEHTAGLASELTSPGPRRVAPLATLVAAVPRAQVRGNAAVSVADLTYRSSEARQDSLFFCVSGANADGHAFAGQAQEAGASVIVVDRFLEGITCTQVKVPAVREAMGPISAAFFAEPSTRLTLVGVTGTNGKTTTTYLLESIFRAAGMSPGVIGTTGVRIHGAPIPFDRTTPEAPDLQRLLAGMIDEGIHAVAMEVSSHGLHQHRIDGSRYACAVFTNLSQDHLDYHASMREYFEAKAMLFTPRLSDRGAVNADSPEGRQLAAERTIPLVTYGVAQRADVRAKDVEVTASGLTFRVGERVIRSILRGTFNVYNSLAALAAAREVGIDDAAIAEGIARLRGVPGRLEAVESGQPFAVLVDYAHTPDSLENVLRAARELTDGRVIVVFGCGGDRDRGKRPLMGEAATRLADLSLITSDNPRSEDPPAIIAEIEPGARAGGGPYSIEPDRRAAISEALDAARSGDVVVIAGKGHETGQQFRDRTVPFDDRVVAAQELAGLGFGGAR
jgi:UDP-N-acetylmuramoyl-L-alanyl-D-glutamate--2,6-diaminopimelate ligase